MRRFSTMIALAVAALLAAPAEAVTLKFDAGRADTTGNINSITWLVQDVADAIDTSGSTTGISLTVTSATGFNENGPNDSGTAAPTAPASSFFDGETTNDALFGHTNNFNIGSPRDLVTYAIAGLDANTDYDYTFYASRGTVSDVRETSYDVDGNVTLLDAGNNVGGIAQLLNITSSATGTATLTMQPGPNNTNGSGFFYLGGMQISTSIPEPGSLLLASLGGLAMLGIGRKHR